MSNSSASPTAGPTAGPIDDRELPAAVEVAEAERAVLLDLARTAVAVAVAVVPEDILRNELDRAGDGGRCAATFVTLTEDGELRGCMGGLDETVPVTRSVVSSAISAAIWDPRFRQLSAHELGRLEIDVSILGPLVCLADPSMLRAGTDGVVVERGGRRGLLLPEVATMHGMDRTQLLDAVCSKAGLPRGAWRDPGTRIYAFRTDRFGGPAVERPGGLPLVEGAAGR